MAINFAQDIAPLRQQYFPMLSGTAAFDRSMEYEATVLDPLRQRLASAQKDAVNLQIQNIAFQRQKMALRQQRDQMRQQREILEAQPFIEQRLEEIRLGDGTPQQKREEFTKVAMENIGLVSRSPVLSSLFQFQDKLLTNRMQEDEKEQRTRNSFANQVAQNTYGTPAFSEELIEGIKSGAVSIQEGSDYLSVIRAETQRREAEMAAQQAQKEQRFTEFKDDFEGYLNNLEGFDIEMKEIDDPSGRKDEKGRPVSIPVKVMAEGDRDDAIRYLLRAKGEQVTKETIKEIEDRYKGRDDDLRTQAILAVEEQLNKTIYGRSKPVLTPQGEANIQQVLKNAGVNPY